MALDTYGDTLEQLPTLPPGPTPDARPLEPTATDYAAMFQERDSGRTLALRRSVVQGQDTPPDRAADVLRLAHQTGIPTDVVGRNYDDIRKTTAIDQTPFPAIVATTPHLADWVADQPTHAALAQADTSPGGQAMDHLGALEWLVTMPSRAIAQAISEERAASLRGTSLLRDLTPAEQDQLNAYTYHAGLDGSVLGARGLRARSRSR